LRAYQIHETNGVDSLRPVKLPNPEPPPGHVLVRVRAVSLNYRDLVVLSGDYGRDVKLPLVPCSDAAGEIIGVGAGASSWKVGDRVAGAFAPGWIEGPPVAAARQTALGGPVDGVLAEQVVFHESAVVGVPAHLTWQEAATLPCAAVTAWNALVATGNLQPGDTILTLGSGGVSLFALQFAKMFGAGVIATTSSKQKAERLRGLGASMVIDYKAEPLWSKRVLALTGGQGVDNVIEVGGAGTLEQSMRSVRYGGQISFIGVVAGEGDFQINRVFMKAIRLQGIFVGSVEMFRQMNQAIAAHKMRPVIDRAFEFTEARSAFEYLAAGGHFGKIVVTVS